MTKKRILTSILIFSISLVAYSQKISNFLDKYELEVEQPLLLLALSSQDCDRCVNVSKYWLKEIKKRGFSNIVLVVDAPSKIEAELLLYKQIKLDSTDLKDVKIIEDNDFYKTLAVKKQSSLIIIENKTIFFKKILSQISSIDDIKFPYFLYAQKTINIPNNHSIPNVYYKFHVLSDSTFIIFNAQYQIIKKIQLEERKTIIEDFIPSDSIYTYFL
ncbi:MAG: hypothetical protein SFU27_10140 [Thermonemataceae bacterium]|nr:hypothetical protein [Thermonemataceae bacterium]